ncbi:flippase [Pantoea sp. B65]|uniref:flippase n=1 Tax=Pantoea sp. B65 TaxID=2813359 RepID=UPI0039B425EC
MDTKVIKNILSLFSIQGMNYVLPLLTLPYLVRVLGPLGYGHLSFSLAIIQYFLLLTQYGFNFSATKRIAESNGNKNDISIIFFNVIYTKVFLCVAGFVILLLTSLVSGQLHDIQIVLIAAYIMVIGDVIFPVWLFQGQEKMGRIALSNIVAKFMTVPLIFIFVKTSNDIALAAFISGLTNLFSGLIGLYSVYKMGLIHWRKPNLNGIKHELSESWHYFLSSAAISLYTATTVVLLGFICGPVVVGYFTAADKIRQAVQGLINPVSQALYPRISALMKNNSVRAYTFLRKLLVIQGIGTLAVSVVLFVFSADIIHLLYGHQFQQSITVLSVLAWLPFIIGLSNIFGIQTLLTTGHKVIFSRVLLMGGILNIIILIPLAWYYSGVGAAISVLSVETAIVFMMFIAIRKLKLPLFIFKVQK